MDADAIPGVPLAASGRGCGGFAPEFMTLCKWTISPRAGGAPASTFGAPGDFTAKYQLGQGH